MTGRLALAALAAWVVLAAWQAYRSPVMDLMLSTAFCQ